MRIPYPELATAVSLDAAEALQAEVREKIRLAPLPPRLHHLLGCDVAYDRAGTHAFAAAVMLDLETLRVIETSVAVQPCTFPYVPGLFAFRELPPILAALHKLVTPPDLVLAEGHGIAHPRGAGLASHLGVVLDVPCIGIAKTPLGGIWTEPPRKAGAVTEVRFDDEKVGFAYRPQADARPVFASPGHLADVASVQTILPRLFAPGDRLPAPLARAHEAAVRARSKAERNV